MDRATETNSSSSSVYSRDSLDSDEGPSSSPLGSEPLLFEDSSSMEHETKSEDASESEGDELESAHSDLDSNQLEISCKEEDSEMIYSTAVSILTRCEQAMKKIASTASSKSSEESRESSPKLQYNPRKVSIAREIVTVMSSTDEENDTSSSLDDSSSSDAEKKLREPAKDIMEDKSKYYTGYESRKSKSVSKTKSDYSIPTRKGKSSRIVNSSMVCKKVDESSSADEDNVFSSMDTSSSSNAQKKLRELIKSTYDSGQKSRRPKSVSKTKSDYQIPTSKGKFSRIANSSMACKKVDESSSADEDNDVFSSMDTSSSSNAQKKLRELIKSTNDPGQQSRRPESETKSDYSIPNHEDKSCRISNSSIASEKVEESSSADDDNDVFSIYSSSSSKAQKEIRELLKSTYDPGQKSRRTESKYNTKSEDSIPNHEAKSSPCMASEKVGEPSSSNEEDDVFSIDSSSSSNAENDLRELLKSTVEDYDDPGKKSRKAESVSKTRSYASIPTHKSKSSTSDISNLEDDERLEQYSPTLYAHRVEANSPVDMDYHFSPSPDEQVYSNDNFVLSSVFSDEPNTDVQPKIIYSPPSPVEDPKEKSNEYTGWFKRFKRAQEADNRQPPPIEYDPDGLPVFPTWPRDLEPTAREIAAVRKVIKKKLEAIQPRSILKRTIFGVSRRFHTKRVRFEDDEQSSEDEVIALWSNVPLENKGTARRKKRLVPPGTDRKQDRSSIHHCGFPCQ